MLQIFIMDLNSLLNKIKKLLDYFRPIKCVFGKPVVNKKLGILDEELGM